MSDQHFSKENVTTTQSNEHNITKSDILNTPSTKLTLTQRKEKKTQVMMNTMLKKSARL